MGPVVAGVRAGHCVRPHRTMEGSLEPKGHLDQPAAEQLGVKPPTPPEALPPAPLIVDTQPAASPLATVV